MATLITELEIRKFQGAGKATLPAGSVLTPSAKDWAGEHHLEIVFTTGENQENIPDRQREKALFLKKTIEIITKKLHQDGISLKTDELNAVAIACLEKLGCQVKP